MRAAIKYRRNPTVKAFLNSQTQSPAEPPAGERVSYRLNLSLQGQIPHFIYCIELNNIVN